MFRRRPRHIFLTVCQQGRLLLTWLMFHFIKVCVCVSLSSHLHSLATWNHNRCSHFTHFRGNRADDQENRKLMFSSLFAFFSYLIRSNDKETQYGTQEAVSEMEESAIMSSEYKVRNGTKEELEFSSWVRPHKQMSFSKPLVLWWHGKSPSPWFPLYNQLWASQSVFIFAAHVKHVQGHFAKKIKWQIFYVIENCCKCFFYCCIICAQFCLFVLYELFKNEQKPICCKM